MRIIAKRAVLLALTSNTLKNMGPSTVAATHQTEQHCNQANTLPVVVVGGGLAGLAASIEASRAGAEVFLLEKSSRIGGNSAKATSGINGVLTPAQDVLGAADSYEAFAADVVKSGGGKSSLELVDLIVRRSSEAVGWLESFGLDLSLLSQCGGHQAPRTHRIPPGPDGRPVPVGWTIVKTVSKHVEDNPEKVKVVTNAHVTALTRDEATGRVIGVRYRQPDQEEEIELPAAAVVLTTGGYAYDRSEDSLLSKFAPQHLHLATTSGSQATGDGVRLGQIAGAALVDMDQIQVHPTSLVDPSDPTNLTKFLAPESMRGSGGIIVDARGKRFANELTTRAVLTEAVFQAGEPMAGDAAIDEGAIAPIVGFLLLNQEAADAFGIGVLGFYMSKGLVRRAANVAEAAQMLKLDDEGKALAATLEAYTAAAKQGGPDEFGKTVFPAKNFAVDEPLYIAIITPAIHYTMGGILINSDARALSEKQSEEADERGDGVALSPIPGLFAAGEVTGGVHGVNRLAGNSLLECVVIGRIAGQNAAVQAAAGVAVPGSTSCSAGGSGEVGTQGEEL